MMNQPNIVILAGGVSSRMKKAATADLDERLQADADGKSKTMIGVGTGNRPFLDYLLFNAREAGYRDVVIVIGERDESIRRYYGTADRGNPFGGLRISYALQRIPPDRVKPLGTADALFCALRTRPDWKGEALTVCNSDNLYSHRSLELMLAVPSGCAMVEYDRSALKFPPARIEQFAVVSKGEDGSLRGIVEKPTREEIDHARDSQGRIGVSMNLWRFPYDWILPCVEEVPLHPVRQEKELPSAVLLLIQRWPGKLTVYRLAEHVPDLTDRNDIRDVQDFLLRHYPGVDFERNE